MSKMATWEENPSIKLFRDYLRIPSVHPDVNYDECVEFLVKQANLMQLPYKIVHVLPKKPVVIITLQGTQPDLESILLNSHMDVVPVFKEHWLVDPFSADISEDGKIYARGAQDMKCVAIQYIEAIKRILNGGVKLKRTLHLSFVPDEEINGATGMGLFINTPEFKSLNIGFSLDEGLANITEEFILYYGERSVWQIEIKCVGQTGHGSLLLDNTAGEKIRRVIDKFMDLREKEKDKLKTDPKLNIGDVMSINLTKLYGGVQNNVIPESLSAVFDIRIPVDVNQDEFEETVKKWCNEIGDGVHISFLAPKILIPPTNKSDLYLPAFEKTFKDMNLKVLKRIFPGATDSRFLRSKGIPAFGFSPMNFTPVLLHDHNEYLHADVFLKGIDIYEQLIQNLANI